jgi:hypothetical protein
MDPEIFPYIVEIDGTIYEVLAPEGEPGYRVRLPDNQVTAYPAHSGDPSEANAPADIAYALANPPVPAPVVPVSVSPKQIRFALNAAGLRSFVDAAASSADRSTQDAWEYATEVRRNDAFVNGMAVALDLSSADVDALFISAAQY